MTQTKSLNDELAELGALEYRQTNIGDGSIEVVTDDAAWRIDSLKDIADEFGYRVVLADVGRAEPGNAFVWHLEVA